VTVDLAQVHSTPQSNDVISTLVYSGQSQDVRDVIIDGQLVMRNRNVLTLNEAKVRSQAQEHSNRLVALLDS
jgi:5-methylthioadenosine/S-adenosylhomocysteine deaminase